MYFMISNVNPPPFGNQISYERQRCNFQKRKEYNLKDNRIDIWSKILLYAYVYRLIMKFDR